MYPEIHTPIKQISEKAIHVNRLSSLIEQAISTSILIVLLCLDYSFSWYSWIGYVLWGLLIIDIFSGIWSIVFRPILLQKYWRYEIDQDYVHLRQGKFKQRNQVIPMAKIQYVGLEQGPILRKYDLYTVSIGTMGSSHRIPTIPKEEATHIRDQIAYLANIADEKGELE
ncbi:MULTISPECIES: PH domain-containing protein [Gracilibacillus]|uniref:PH domain-containing protein n=1 Tax=Gracilibacillus TaxID=74385 RepID=UPI00082569EF|nr:MULTISPECIES: PH domain-containing protein [Gracilibacillus]